MGPFAILCLSWSVLALLMFLAPENCALV